MAGGPYAFHFHTAAWLVIVALGVGYGVVVRRLARSTVPIGTMPTRRQWWYLAGGLVTLALALTWPVADLAAHWSLTALVVQRLLITLAAVPLLMLAVPAPLFAAVTRPAAIDRVLEVLTRPPIAVATFTVVAVGTLLTPVVATQATSPAVRGAVDALLVVGGVVLWGPVLRHIPGASSRSCPGSRPSSMSSPATPCTPPSPTPTPPSGCRPWATRSWPGWWPKWRPSPCCGASPGWLWPGRSARMRTAPTAPP